MMQEISEADWERFTRMVPEIRERYLRAKNEELVDIIQNEEMTSTERFRRVEEHTRRARKVLNLCLEGHSRSTVAMFMALMYRYEMLTDEDLEHFGSLAGQIRGFSAI